ncbi:hypothetical protein POM88_052498 [Heracleum sosnowskyi]|uniref:Uncharacterized protein n=1 Tax=Heracleum sosnowskyi TaxID=360622 RepID=A0AAD8GRQ7_9APIA|nr:hypothetical protein POM88_052498 [Heracleum sosnowskyi]
MGYTAFVSSGLEFVPNNYVAPLVNVNAPKAFHLMHNFLAQSPIGRALVEPERLSGFQETEYVITPGTVRAAMGFGEHIAYTIVVGDAELLRMMREIGYGGSLAKIGQLKRPFLRKERSFFFDCITRTFGKKCTNWDAIPTDSLQIGYSLLYGTNFDFGRLVLSNLGEKMNENRGVVYFARFCQLLFSACVSGVDIIDADVIPCFKLHKRIFSDLVNKDVKKGDVGGRIKHRAFKLAKTVKPATEVGVSKSSMPKSDGPSKKRRAKRPRSDDEEDTETLHQRRRRLVADYLFDELDTEVVPEAEQNEAPDVVTEEADVNVEATVPIEDIVNVDELVEDNNAVNARADAAHADVDNFVDPLDMDFEAHPAFSVCDTEDVAADQATLVVDESMATHTEILSVTNQILELGEEVDQEAKSVSSEKIVEAAVEKLDEATTENLEEDVLVENSVKNAVLAEEEVAEAVNSEKNEAVAEQIHDEAAQLNIEVTAENIVADPLAENVDEGRVVSDSYDHISVNSDHANSGINIALSDSDDHDSIPFLRDPTAESIKENQHATEAHFREMYYANWSGADCIFSTQRTADFVDKSAKEISNPELLTHLKATIVQVKSLHNRFDETHKAVIGLRNDSVAKELALKNDRAQYSSMIKDQVEIKQRLCTVERNQDVMSTKIDSIAVSLELLTSVLIPDDVKKGERVPKDKCKRAPTLRRRDDATDGGSKESEKRSKSAQEQGRLRSNSAKLTNSGRVNSGAQSSSRLKSLVISANPITDEEIAAKLFLEEHGGEATVEDMDAEMQILAEEHKKKVEAGTYKKKAVKAPRRKEQGISIKENVNSQQSLQYSRRPVGASTDKGKGKLIEEPELSKKAHSTSDMAQVESRPNQSTTDVAQVDNSAKIVTTYDTAQVVQTQLISSQLQGIFGKPTRDETLKPGNVNFLQTRSVLGKESYDKSGLGSHREKRINNSPLDHTSLAEPGVGVTQESLEKLESVQMIYHKGIKKEFLLYFMADGRVYRVGEADIHLKLWEELEYVLYLLKVKNQSTHNAAQVLKERMMKSKVLLGARISSAYIPKYRDAHGKLVEMKMNSARFRTALGIRVLEFNLESDKSFFIRLGNEMNKNSIYSLRAAIYQTGERDPVKELKEIMTAELERAERRLLTDYLRTMPDIEEIK